jgi:aminotransferase class I and II
MKYNFNEIIDRKGTDSLKYDFAVERGLPKDVLPLWVADMDFPVEDHIKEALIKASEHAIFGYSDTKDDYFEVLSSWYERRFFWKVKKEWMVKTPGVVFAIAMAIQALTRENEAIIIQEPVYYPFSSTIRANNRKLVINNLVLKKDKYHIDFVDFEKKIIENNVKLFILCSPHNPVGRVWTGEELQKLANICLKHKVYIFSDEIHSDLVYEKDTHTIFANLGKDVEDSCIVATAPSKTFNIAGLQVSNIWIANKKMRDAFKEAIDRAGYSQLNNMGLIATKVAYKYGEEWLEELKIYLKSNIDFVRKFLKDKLPNIKLIEPEGTYLLWVDCRELGLSEKERQGLIQNKAKLWLDTGTMFGKAGAGFERMNIACPRKTLEEAMNRLKEAING